MTETAPVTGEMDRRDLYAVIRTLTPGAKYLASDLFKKYERQARAAGRVPANVNAVGRTLRAIGCERRKMGTGNKARAAWLITGEAMAGANS